MLDDEFANGISFRIVISWHGKQLAILIIFASETLIYCRSFIIQVNSSKLGSIILASNLKLENVKCESPIKFQRRI